MMKRAIINGKIITSSEILEDKVLIFDEKIIAIKDSVDNSDIEIIDAKGNYVSAGFIDIHIHGSGGADTMDSTFEALNTISTTILQSGTTSFLATTMTMSKKRIYEALESIKEYKDTLDGANLLGVHMEGPFINPAKSGAQDSKYIISGDIEMIDRYQEIIYMITLAPEIDDNLSFIKTISQNYPHITLSIGHSSANYQESKESFDAGISHSTHLFNAMPPYHHRDVGIIGAVFDDDRVSCDIIADGIHTHPSTIDLTYRLKRDNLILITDSMRAGCMRDGIYDLGGQKVKVKEQKATLSNGTLAGSVLSLNMAIRNLLNYTKCSLVEAISTVTTIPAKKLDINKGSLKVGFDADIVIFDKDIDVKTTIINGRIKYIKI